LAGLALEWGERRGVGGPGHAAVMGQRDGARVIAS
jgi:hypothetical protein